MKKLLSMLIALTLVFGMTFTATAATTKVVTKTIEKTGIIKAFNSASILIIENGKAQGYNLASDAKIMKNGEEVDLLETAKKGMKVKFKVVTTTGKPSYVTYIELPNIGSILEGIPGTSMSNEVNTQIDWQETAASKVTKNANSMIEASTIAIKKELEVDYDSFEIQSNGSVLYIGVVIIVPNSMQLTIDGKSIKIIDSAAEFNKATAGDEAKLAASKTGVYTLTLETPLTQKQITERDNSVKLTYKTKAFDIQRLELANLVLNEDVYCELNGKEVSYAKAMYRGNYAAFVTNEDLEIIYVNAYFKNLEATVAKITATSITVDIMKNGKVAFTETLGIDPGCTITSPEGEELQLSNITIGGKVLITTSPDLGYKVSEIVVQ